MFRCLYVQPNFPNIMVTVQRIGHFCCLILLKNLVFCNAGLVVTSEFTYQSRFDNIYLPFPLPQMTTKSASLLKCVVECQSLPGCQSVRYHVISRACHLLDSCLICNIGQSEMGWRYYCRLKDESPISSGTPDKHIAFQATINNDVPANGGVIVFNQVNTNLGQGYNSTSGIFTIWRDGVYIFTWSVQRHPVTRKYTDTYLFVNGEAVGKLHDKSENLVTNSAMFHLKSHDQVYICSSYTTLYVGAMSQFSGWLQSPDFQMSYPDDCGISFHGYAVSANDENVLSYQSKENLDERRSRLITTSNVTIVLMSNTVVNRGLTSEMQHVIDGENVTLSVIDGQCTGDVGVFLVTVATADFGGSTFEIKNRKTHFHIASCTLTAFCLINGPAFNIWAAGRTLNTTVIFDDIITSNAVTINKTFGTVYLLQRGIYFLSWTVHAYNDSVILSSLAVDDVNIRNLTVTSPSDCHTVSTNVALLPVQAMTTIKIKILVGEIGKLGVYISGFLISSFET